MDEYLTCVERRSLSPQEVEVSGIAAQEHFKEVQESQAAEDFINLEESGENDSTVCPEGFLTSIPLVVGEENQELSGLSGVEEELSLGSVGGAEEIRLVKSEAEEELSLGSVGGAEEIRLVKSSGCEAILVRPANEAGENHSVKSNDLESREETVYESIMKNSGRNCVSLKIKVIDDTAVIDGTSVTRGNGYRSETIRTRTDEKRGKRPRRKAKCGKQGLEANGRGGNKVQTVEVQKNETGTKKIYSRKEMEVLRYIHTEEQREMWMVIRCSLGPVVLKEYDDLANCLNQKHIRVNFDPWQQFAKKERAPSILGDVNSSNVDGMQNMDPVDPAYGFSVGGGNICTDSEEGSGDGDSDEDYSSIQRPAFVVEGEPNFDSGPPEDGLEYLRRVRWEAARIPDVKVAKLDRNKLNKEQTAYMPKIPDIAKCPEELAPLEQWEDEFLADFAELRAALSHLEEDSGVENSNRSRIVCSSHEDFSCQVLESPLPEQSDNLILDAQPPDCSAPKSSDDHLLPVSTIHEGEMSLSPENSSPRVIANERSEDYPLLSVIRGMDSVARVSMLRKRINSLETKSSLSRSDGVWLFALCAAVDTPLHADMCAALRSMLRKCASLRAEKLEVDDDELVMLNILVTIAGRHFKQSEN